MQQKIEVVRIAGKKRFSLEGKIFLIREDFGDMFLISSKKDYFLYFAKLGLLTPCDKHCQKNVLSDGKSLSCLGIKFKKVRKDSFNGTYVVTVNGKNIYFHYEENEDKQPLLVKVSIPQFG
jgi:hypothetical protein